MSKRVVLGVTGSIAAYKAAELLRLMMGQGWSVTVAMTEAATKFVSELTFRTLSQRPVASGLFDEDVEWRPEHIALADWAELVVVAPCTANVLAKFAHGLADDVVTCTLLATQAPVVIAPAMNEKMWDHPATQDNLALLRSRGVRILDVGEGDLACGYKGRGRMLDPVRILDSLLALPPA